MLPGINVSINTSSVTEDSQTYSTPGTYIFDTSTLLYNEITFEVYGGGGGGGAYPGGAVADGTAGGTSSVVLNNGTVSGTGGGGGKATANPFPDTEGGIGSGPAGTTTASGQGSATVTSFNTVIGGNAGGPEGGLGGVGDVPGNPPGGGGGGIVTRSPGGNTRWASGGGGGGYASFTTFDPSNVPSSITVTVGAAGTGYRGGSAGRAKISWR